MDLKDWVLGEKYMTTGLTRTQCLALAIRKSLSTLDTDPVQNTTSTGIWCWHCCHPFPGDPIPLPISYDDRTQKWKTMGSFCSWNCAKGFNTDSHRHNGVRGMLLTLLRKRMTGKLEHLVPAPPRCCLKVFGGTMTIDEFREKSINDIIVSKLPPKMIPLETIIHERKVNAKRQSDIPGPDLEQSVDLSLTTQKNEAFRLKRPRPMPSSSDVLARTMGLEFFGKN